ncbi:MAG: hypothetical protein ACOC2D_12250 [Spirochaetota bacterium]
MIARRLVVSAMFAVSLAAGGAPPATAQWYLSNEFGIVRDPVDEEAVDEHEYVMHVERSPSLETRTLYRDSEAIGRTELEYVDGRLLVRRRYRHEELEAAEYFRYWADGTLRVVRRVAERGSTVEYRYRDGRLDEEWLLAGAAAERTRYDAAGRIVARARWEDDELVEREEREYWGEDADDPLRRVVVVADATETVSRYDESGRLLGSSVTAGGEIASDRTRVFEDGLLVEEREQSGGVGKVWRYAYDGDELIEERFFEDGELVKVTDYRLEGFTRMETLHRDGEPALRVYYDGRDRAREEVVRDGEVIRTRTFAAPAGGGEDRDADADPGAAPGEAGTRDGPDPEAGP